MRVVCFHPSILELQEKTLCCMGLSNDAHCCTRTVFGGHGRSRNVHLDRDEGRNENRPLEHNYKWKITTAFPTSPYRPCFFKKSTFAT